MPQNFGILDAGEFGWPPARYAAQSCVCASNAVARDADRVRRLPGNGPGDRFAVERQGRMTGTGAAAGGPTKAGDRSGNRHRHPDAGLLVRRATRPGPQHYPISVQRRGSPRSGLNGRTGACTGRSACPNPLCVQQGCTPHWRNMAARNKRRAPGPNGQRTRADVPVSSLGRAPGRSRFGFDTRTGDPRGLGLRQDAPRGSPGTPGPVMALCRTGLNAPAGRPAAAHPETEPP